MKNIMINKEENTAVAPLFNYLGDCIRYRLSKELTNEALAIPKLYLDRNDSNLSKFIKYEKLNNQEVMLLLLAIVPHVLPNLINGIITEFLPNGGDFPEFGGVKGKNHRGILPTVETAIYIIAGNDPDTRIESLYYLQHLNKWLFLR